MISSELSSLFLQQSLQIALVTAVVWGLAATAFRRRPQMTYVLWMLVLVKAVTPPFGSAMFSIWNLLPSAGTESVTANAVVRQFTAAEFLTMPIEQYAVVENLNGQTWSDVAEEFVSPSISTIAGIVWACGVLAMLFVSFRAIQRVNQLVRRNTCEDDSRLNESVHQLARELKVRTRPAAVVLDCPIGPAVRRILRPQLLFPKTLLAQVSDEHLRLIVLHELMHIRRRDVLAGYFQAAVQVLWWFHPAVWLASGRCSHDRERCCDDGVLMHSRTASSIYAECLLETARTCRNRTWVPLVAGMSGVTNIRGRMQHIMSIRSRTPGWIVACFAGLIGMLILPGAQQSQKPETSASFAEASDEQASAPDIKIPVPRIVAMTWQKGTEGSGKHTDLKLWAADGTLLTDQQISELRAEAPGTEIHWWATSEEPQPLVFIFDVGDKLPVGSGGVSVHCEFPDGHINRGGTWGNRVAAKVNAGRIYAVSTDTDFLPRGGEFNWPESVKVHLKYPVEIPVLVKTLTAVPAEAVEIADGVVWYIDPQAGYDVYAPRIINAPTPRFPAAVLETIQDGSLDLVDYSVRVHLKNSEKELQGSRTTIRDRDGKRYQVDVSDRFPPSDEIDRIEVYRQRFTRSVIKDVRLRTDLIPEMTE